MEKFSGNILEGVLQVLVSRRCKAAGLGQNLARTLSLDQARPELVIRAGFGGPDSPPLTYLLIISFFSPPGFGVQVRGRFL